MVQLPLISAGAQKAQMLGPTGLVIRRNGYLYVYLSNESAQDVFFDNLTIQHRRGPVVEEHDYYAFGLEIPGLSTQANKYEYNPDRYKYNGNELQNKEFSDGSGLETYHFNARTYDPQIGRFLNQDPLAEATDTWSPYSFPFDNPSVFADPYGLAGDSTTPKPPPGADVKPLPEVVVVGKKEAFVNPPTIIAPLLHPHSRLLLPQPRLRQALLLRRKLLR